MLIFGSTIPSSTVLIFHIGDHFSYNINSKTPIFNPLTREFVLCLPSCTAVSYFPKTQKSHSVNRSFVPYLLDRKFWQDSPNTFEVTDIIYIPIEQVLCKYIL